MKRVLGGIAFHFPTRFAEWILAAALIGWGWILIGPEATFATSPAYAKMAAMWSETTWGLMALVVGAVRVAALAVNGTFADTWYSKASPVVRALMSGLSCFVWAQIALGLIGAPILTPGVFAYAAFFLLDAWNVVRAAGDAGTQGKTLADGDV